MIASDLSMPLSLYLLDKKIVVDVMQPNLGCGTPLFLFVVSTPKNQGMKGVVNSPTCIQKPPGTAKPSPDLELMI